jgi:hypothetical protein
VARAGAGAGVAPASWIGRVVFCMIVLWVS